VTQDQFSLVSKKDFGIPEDNFSKNIEVFDRLSQMSNFFDNKKWLNVSKLTPPGRELSSSG
jgi:hypothetical protein